MSNDTRCQSLGSPGLNLGGTSPGIFERSDYGDD
jgi:hypothetical protein